MPRKQATPKMVAKAPSFAALVKAISDVNLHTQGIAAKAVNVALTSRNWLIGTYIHEYELHGRDRAEYGERLIDRLAEALQKMGVVDMSARSLRLYQQFYNVYPDIWQSSIAESGLVNG